MSFAFGSAPAFGASTAPAFGAGGAFGAPASSTPAFGAASSAPAFSFNQPAAAATAASTGFAFSSASAFGASSSSMFGASPTPSMFGQASSPSLFAGTTTPSLFGAASTPATTSGFSFGSAATQASSLLGSTMGQLGQGQQQPTTQITYSTKYDDLHPTIQNELQSIQREISSYRDECEKLNRDTRLHDATALKRSMEEETGALKRGLEGLANAIKTDDESLADFREKVMQLLRSTETAVRTFQRAKLWREAPQMYKGQAVPPQVHELLSTPVSLPNPYLELAVQGFADVLDSYRQVVCELEAALPPDLLSAAVAKGTGGSLATVLPTVVSHMHDFFVHVAAQLEQVHAQVEHAKNAFLSQRQANGDMTNPFADSRRHQHLTSAANRPVVIPPASHNHHHNMAQGHGAGHQLHPGTAHGPGGMPTPGAFGTPLTAGAAGAATPFGQSTPGGDDASRKQAKGRRK